MFTSFCFEWISLKDNILLFWCIFACSVHRAFMYQVQYKALFCTYTSSSNVLYHSELSCVLHISVYILKTHYMQHIYSSLSLFLSFSLSLLHTHTLTHTHTHTHTRCFMYLWKSVVTTLTSLHLEVVRADSWTLFVRSWREPAVTLRWVRPKIVPWLSWSLASQIWCSRLARIYCRNSRPRWEMGTFLMLV